MVRNIIQIGDKRLNQVSLKIAKPETLSRGIKQLIRDLLDTCNSDVESSAGLSAVQIGVLKRIYIVRRVDIEEADSKPIWEIMINPEIKILGHSTTIIWEGCMSVGVNENRLFAPVERAERVEVSYINEKGKKKKLKAEGYISHIIQHEQDHLNGILFPKYVEDPRNIWKAAKLDKYIKEHGAYPPIFE